MSRKNKWLHLCLFGLSKTGATALCCVHIYTHTLTHSRTHAYTTQVHRNARGRCLEQSTDMQHVWHDSFISLTWLMHVCNTHDRHMSDWHNFFTLVTRVTWLIPTCDIIDSHVWHDSFPRVTWLIQTRDMTHPHMWRDSSTHLTWITHMCVACLIHMRDKTYSHVWYNSFTLACRLPQVRGSHVHMRVACLTHICDNTSSHVWYNSFTLACRLPRDRHVCLQLFCRKKSIYYRTLLRKDGGILRGSFTARCYSAGLFCGKNPIL